MTELSHKMSKTDNFGSIFVFLHLTLFCLVFIISLSAKTNISVNQLIIKKIYLTVDCYLSNFTIAGFSQLEHQAAYHIKE